MRTVHFAAALALMLGAACSHSTPAPQTASESHATSSAQEQQLASVTIDELAGMLERHDQVAIYDNNGPDRYAQGHIPTARHVGHDEVTAAILPPDHGARLVFYCANEH